MQRKYHQNLNQIMTILHEVYTKHRTARAVGRQFRVHPSTIYTWKMKYGHLLEPNTSSKTADKTITELAEENTRLKLLIADMYVNANA